MRCVELCFHERDSRAAELAARGLTEAGLCVLRRPVNDRGAPAPSPAAEARVLLHSPAIAALAADHPARPQFQQPMTVVPVGGSWPLRSSRPWLFAAPTRGDLDSPGFWKVVAWAAAQATGLHGARIAAQRAVFAALRTVKPARLRRRPLAPRFRLAPIEPVSSARDWERAVTPLAVAGTLAVAALVSGLVIDAASRPEAWSAIARAPAIVEAGSR